MRRALCWSGEKRKPGAGVGAHSLAARGSGGAGHGGELRASQHRQRVRLSPRGRWPRRDKPPQNQTARPTSLRAKTEKNCLGIRVRAPPPSCAYFPRRTSIYALYTVPIPRIYNLCRCYITFGTGNVRRKEMRS